MKLFMVAGSYYSTSAAKAMLRTVQLPCPVVFEPEPSNKYDSGAIKVVVQDQVVGYPRRSPPMSGISAEQQLSWWRCSWTSHVLCADVP